MNNTISASSEATLSTLGLELDSFDAFVAGESTDSKYTLDEGSYDGIVRGYVIKNHVFDGTNYGPKIQLIWQTQDSDGNVHTLLGNRWKLSADERSKFRAEISKWFGKTDWAAICDILVKGKILVNVDGRAQFDIGAFIGKKGKLLIGQETSKKGKTFNNIMSISAAGKNAGEIKLDDIPEYITKDALKFVLANGVGIRVPQSKDGEQPAANAGVSNKPIVDDDDDNLPF